MPAEQADGFADNWAYLRTELHWLDRLLVTAVAKQRKETKEIDRIAQSKADRASSHWWKGVIVPDGNVSYDEYRQPAQTTPKASYQHQVDAQIQATQKRGVVLALPALCHRLKLTSFEKNVVLMSLAPEVNRRYARLYRYLQGEEASQTDLPTLDLVLRLLCKNDSDWRSSRNHLINESSLTHYGLLDLLPTEDTLLNCPLKLSEPLVNYLLADQPTIQDLEALLSAAETVIDEIPGFPLPPAPPLPKAAFLRHTTATVDWSRLVLPAATLDALQSLEWRIQGSTKAAERWGLAPEYLPQPGLTALLIGAAGTGKTTAAAALATALQTSLVQVDLAILEPAEYPQLLAEIAETAPTVLLIQSAQLWLKRSSQMSSAAVRQFWQQRCSVASVTLFSVTHQASVHTHWQQQIDQILQFPMPNKQARLCLWQQAFPASVPLDAEINWQALAAFPISGGEIQSVVHETITYAAREAVPQINYAHILKALSLRAKKSSIQTAPIRVRKP